MPSYNYRCEKCGDITEDIRAVADRHESDDCKSCEKGKLLLTMEPVPFHFKGGGWSKDLYQKRASQKVRNGEIIR